VEYVEHWGRTYLHEIKHRLFAFHPLHMLLIGEGGLVLGALAVLRRHTPDWRMLGFLASILVGELLWFIVMREHSHGHVHTMALLFASMSVAAGLAAVGLADLVGRWRPGRVVAWAVGIALLVMAVAHVGVTPYGNVRLVIDWEPTRQKIEPLAEAIPPHAVVVFDLAPNEPSPELFLDRTYVRRGRDIPLGDRLTRWYIVTESNPESERYQRTALIGTLVAESGDLAVFVVNATP
jgi:hypothetical protein